MKNILILGFVLTLVAAPLQAQDADDEIADGFNLIQQGAQLLMRGLLAEIGPAMLELEGRLIDLSLYHAPEVLPNGDIIIRRRIPPEETGETEL